MMKMSLTSEAKELIADSKDPIIFMHRSGCACGSVCTFVDYGSKTSVEPTIRKLALQEIGEVEGIPVFVNDRLKSYLGHARVQTMTIGADTTLETLTVTLTR